MQKIKIPFIRIPHYLSLISILSFLCCVSGAFAADITISQNTTWAPGIYTYDNVLIANNATLTLQSNSATGDGVTLNAVNLIIEAGAAISGDAMLFLVETPQDSPAVFS